MRGGGCLKYDDFVNYHRWGRRRSAVHGFECLVGFGRCLGWPVASCHLVWINLGGRVGKHSSSFESSFAGLRANALISVQEWFQTFWYWLLFSQGCFPPSITHLSHSDSNKIFLLIQFFSFLHVWLLILYPCLQYITPVYKGGPGGGSSFL